MRPVRASTQTMCPTRARVVHHDPRSSSGSGRATPR
jgi:hypothetical protein